MIIPCTVGQLIDKLKKIDKSKEIVFECGYNFFDILKIKETDEEVIIYGIGTNQRNSKQIA